MPITERYIHKRNANAQDVADTLGIDASQVRVTFDPEEGYSIEFKDRDSLSAADRTKITNLLKANVVKRRV